MGSSEHSKLSGQCGMEFIIQQLMALKQMLGLRQEGVVSGETFLALDIVLESADDGRDPLHVDADKFVGYL